MHYVTHIIYGVLHSCVRTLYILTHVTLFSPTLQASNRRPTAGMWPSMSEFPGLYFLGPKAIQKYILYVCVFVTFAELY